METWRTASLKMVVLLACIILLRTSNLACMHQALTQRINLALQSHPWTMHYFFGQSRGAEAPPKQFQRRMALLTYAACQHNHGHGMLIHRGSARPAPTPQ